MRSNYDDDGFGGPMKPQMTDSVGAQPWNTPYTAPPRKEWVGLTDEEIRKMHYEERFFGLLCDSDKFEKTARAIEAKLKEKNG